MFGRKKETTVRARFIGHSGAISNLHRTDMARMGASNQSAMYEKHLLIFQEEGSDRELRFSVSGDLRAAWSEGQEGLLTYAGRKFVGFVPQ